MAVASGWSDSAVVAGDLDVSYARSLPDGESMVVKVGRWTSTLGRVRVMSEPIGSTEAIVVSESTPAPLRGSLSILVETLEEYDRVAALLNGQAPIRFLLGAPVGESAGQIHVVQVVGPVIEQELAGPGTRLAHRWLNAEWVEVAAP